MKLEAIELVRLLMPLVNPFRSSSGIVRQRDVLLIHAIAEHTEGWGECCATEAPLYTSEYIAGAQHVIRGHLVPRLFAHGDILGEEVADVLRPVVGHRMAKSAIEMAILDAELQGEGRSLADRLGATRQAVDCGVSIGIVETPALLASIHACCAQGYRRVKLKIEPGSDVEVVRAVRAEFGELPLQVDANAAYTLADLDHLRRLDEFGLLMIEQPLPEDQLLAHAELARQIRTPVCLDESIVSAAVAADALQLGACSVVNIKPSRVGGYLEAVRIHDHCRERGVPAWCGGMHETGLGRTANIALAALPGFTLPGDISASDRYFQRDITDPFVLQDGRLRVPTGPGIGAHLRRDLIDELTTERETIRR